MARRRLTVKRLDPWSVLKFGFVANLVLLTVFLLVSLVVWFIIDRLAIVDQLCSIALDVGFTECGVNFGNLFQALALLGLLWVVVQTAVLVFLSFLHNLIADLTGGLAITVYEDAPAGGTRPAGATMSAGTAPTGGARPRGSTAATRPGAPRTGSPERDATATGDAKPTPRTGPDPRTSAETPRRGSAGDDESDEVMFGDRGKPGST